ncbi:MAG: hypothetical protein IPP45_09840 [Sphingomonadales bacterium]|nr:hypothetical protein [Sphingomonadales bacterium]
MLARSRKDNALHLGIMGRGLKRVIQRIGRPAVLELLKAGAVHRRPSALPNPPHKRTGFSVSQVMSTALVHQVSMVSLSWARLAEAGGLS